jgi:hypothetical protein
MCKDDLIISFSAPVRALHTGVRETSYIAFTEAARAAIIAEHGVTIAELAVRNVQRSKFGTVDPDRACRQLSARLGNRRVKIVISEPVKKTAKTVPAKKLIAKRLVRSPLSLGPEYELEVA